MCGYGLRSSATKIFISNLMTQPGETSGLSAAQHIRDLEVYAPQVHFAHVILNSQPISNEQRSRYALEGSEQIGLDEGELIARSFDTNIIYANLLDDGEKVRHDPKRLAVAVLSCVRAMAAA